MKIQNQQAADDVMRSHCAHSRSKCCNNRERASVFAHRTQVLQVSERPRSGGRLNLAHLPVEPCQGIMMNDLRNVTSTGLRTDVWPPWPCELSAELARLAKSDGDI
ncbi:Hypothetical protein SMAX5B_002413 [Scophthalmus maximus]|uniref:Uncharacterized protein n=1 Tax=Scophthalmus maximus TaxID=52904 RepID=A0A2U9AVT5_SCOMX|nr:Hypothetical protein SMAX5B_002413 [Scophthalmus maximus]KAF0044861.1 hypothetical protein F2P81_001390 [Scophthalmus maximus]